MKILCVTSNFPRWEGDSTTPFVLHLAEDLNGLGWQVDVLAPHAPGAATRETLNGINVTRFRYLFPEKAETVCYNGGALLNLRKRKSNYLKLPPLVWAEFFNVARFLARGDYDLVHSHWILPQGFTCALASGIFGTPHVMTIHGGDVFALQNNLLNRFKNYALRKCSAVTVKSSTTRQKALDLEPNLTELHQIPMGVATRKVPEGSKEVSRLRSLYRQGDGPLLVFVGRYVDEKGP